MAILVRKLIVLFLMGVKKHGLKKFLRMLEQREKEFNDRLKDVKTIDKKSQYKDMYENYKEKPAISYEFSDKFTILRINFL